MYKFKKLIIKLHFLFEIRFFPGVFLYCVVGVLVNKGAGKTGKEMIPNSKFWSDLPGLIAVSELFYSLI